MLLAFMSHIAHSGPQYCCKCLALNANNAPVLSLNKLVQWVTDSGGVERMAFMRKSSDMLFFLDVDCQDWLCLLDGATLKDVEQFGDPWPRPANSQPLTDKDVRLPRTLADFPYFERGRNESPRYGKSNLWRDVNAELVKYIGQSALLPTSLKTTFASALPTTVASITTTTVTVPAAGSAQPAVILLLKRRRLLRLRYKSRQRKRRLTMRYPRHRRSIFPSLCLALWCHWRRQFPSDPRYRPFRRERAVSGFLLWLLYCFRLL